MGKQYGVDRNKMGLEDQKLLTGPVADTPSSSPSQRYKDRRGIKMYLPMAGSTPYASWIQLVPVRIKDRIRMETPDHMDTASWEGQNQLRHIGQNKKI